MKKQLLASAWKKRCELWKKGHKFKANGTKLRDRAEKLWEEFRRPGNKHLWTPANKLSAEGSKLWTKSHLLAISGERLRIEGVELCYKSDLFWINAVIAKRTGVTFELSPDGSCKLSNGEIYLIHPSKEVSNA